MLKGFGFLFLALYVDAFVVNPTSLRLKNARSCPTTIRRPGVCSLNAVIDRRDFLAAAAVIFSQIDKDRDGVISEDELKDFSVPSISTISKPSGNPSTKISQDLVDKIANGLLRLSNKSPYEDKAIALFSDGSDGFAAAEAAIKQVGGTAVVIDPKLDIEEIRELYGSSDCVAAMVPGVEVIKTVMDGRGIECKRCGYYGDSSSPKWFVVLGKTSKTGVEMQLHREMDCACRTAFDRMKAWTAREQKEADLFGRVCDAESGACFQIGVNIPVYTVDDLSSAPPERAPSRGG